MDEAAKSRASLQESLSSRTVAVAKTAGFCLGWSGRLTGSMSRSVR